MPAHRYLNETLSLAARALARGGFQVNPSRVRWVCSGDCKAPFVTEHYARPSKTLVEKAVVITRETQHPMCVEIHTRCRKCDRCRRQRSSLWRERAKAETSLSARTWFGTLTVRPEVHYEMLCRASESMRLRAVDFGALPADQQFTAIHRHFAREITLMLKRLREQVGHSFRYLIVTEVHQSGLPHFHLLIHEQMDGSVKYAQLEKAWRLGFTKWKLVTDAKQATYLCKYLSKDARSRVRASLAYGSPVEPSAPLGHKSMF